MGVIYRVRQFWQDLFSNTDPGELEQALALLNTDQAALFRQLQSGEQTHALRMVRKLEQRGDHHPDLLVAALLHDVGKLRYRMNPFERSLVVLARAVMPGRAQKWGQLSSGGWEGVPRWRKAFVLAEQHATWGAEMARRAGTSEVTTRLIRAHQDRHRNDLGDLENDFLGKLWEVDNES